MSFWGTIANRNPWLPKVLDLASSLIVATEFALIFWGIGVAPRYQYVHPAPWWMWVVAVQLPVFPFAIIWLFIRSLRALTPWWQSLSVRDPAMAVIVRVLVVLSPLLFVLMGFSLIELARFLSH